MENEIDDFREKITPEKAQKMLKDEGMNVTLEEAKEILHFLRKLANIAVLKYLDKK
ncbi:hypothetical protein [Flavobacterium sp. Root420]|uniref:hypothetical protein n=1 Tax=Flavobacterium sp. Root420 TaxID=1736533 RepID=UPI000A63A1E0|nr:hypothetical protein [Flavobacterium sp. Root420]